jgi:hypothetical protein
VNLKGFLNRSDTKMVKHCIRNFCVAVAYSLYFCLLIAVLAACQPKPTPFPVDIPPTPTLTPVPGVPVPIRYGLAANTAGFVHDLDMIAASGSLEQLTEAPDSNDIGARFDVIAAFGKWSGAAESPVLPRVALVINSSLAPMDNPTVANVVRRAPDPTAILATLNIPGAEAAPIETAAPITLRTELANAGWPDGFDAALAYITFPGILEIKNQLAAIGIIGQPIPLSDSVWERTHLAIIIWTTPGERAEWVERAGGESNVIDLYSLPISYWTAPGLTITFTPGGWPLTAR